jgi:hypothetical protein
MLRPPSSVLGTAPSWRVPLLPRPAGGKLTERTP